MLVTMNLLNMLNILILLLHEMILSGKHHALKSFSKPTFILICRQIPMNRETILLPTMEWNWFWKDYMR